MCFLKLGKCIKVKYVLPKTWKMEQKEPKVRWKFLWLTSWKTNYILFQRDAPDDEKGPKMVRTENKERLPRWKNKARKEIFQNYLVNYV